MISASALQAQANRNRRTIVDMIHTANAGHPGGSLSVIDVLTAIYATDVDLKAAERSRVCCPRAMQYLPSMRCCTAMACCRMRK